MIHIDEKSIKELLKVRPGTKYAVTKVIDGALFHSLWFVFLCDPAKIVACDHESPFDLTELLKWREVTEPPGVELKKGMPLMGTDPGDPEETVVRLRTSDPTIVAHLKGEVYDWVTTHFDNPEFWVRGVDQVVAIKEAGKLIGGVGPTRLRVENPKVP